MYQEYRDWEKAFQKQTAGESANIDTNKLWQHLKSHVPENRKQNRWLPFLLIVGLLSLALPSWLWVQNTNLKAANKSLGQELAANKLLLLECKALAQNSNRMKDPFSVPTNVLKAESGNREQNKYVSQRLNNFLKSYTPKLVSPDQHFLQLFENTTPSNPLREAIVVSNLNPRKLGVTLEPELFEIAINKHKRKNTIAPPSGFVQLTFTGSGSGLKGNYLSSDLAFLNNVNYQLGLQLNAAKFLNRNWFVGVKVNYNYVGNVTNYTSTTKDRNETTGTTQILIDGNGNISSSEGVKGTTIFHRVKAELYNVHHQILLGPGIGYSFIQSDKVNVNLYASAQWLLSSHFSGKTPLGSETFAGGESQQWLYRLRYPQLGLGADWNQQLFGKLYMSIGLHTGFQSDQLGLAGRVLSRKGFFYGGHLGLQKYF